jgi:DNA mismatch repair protein MutL
LDIIQLLPDHVANQIAAGEVIQRPSSAVKEMLENAIDSGADQIKLIIKDAGKTLIQVVDNGCGMSETDARMSFERHATSKIREANDLFSIRTMGFRGEAMASMAAIAHVEMRTKLHSEDLGTKLIIEGSEVKEQESCATNNGTSISIKNLFYNVPARRNFLKSDQVELKHIIEEFQRASLAHPEIGMSMHHNEQELFHLTAGTLRQRIVGIFGNKYNEKLVPVEEETNLVQVSGYVGKPEFARKTRGEQYFFVNTRFIKSSYLHHAVSRAFDELIPSGYHPSYFLFFDVDPQLIDVNIHPTKTEIKFEDEKAIYAIVRSCVKRALGQHNIAPSLDFDRDPSFDNIPKPSGDLQRPSIKVDTSYNPFESKSSLGSSHHSPPKQRSTEGWEQLFENIPSAPSQPKQMLIEQDFTEESEQQKVCFQLHEQYILSHIKSGLLIVHQQRAHERILYEHFMALGEQQGNSQQLLFPQNVELSSADMALVQELNEDIRKLGFDFEKLNQHTLVIQGVPAESTEESAQELFEELLEEFKQSADIEASSKEKLARSLAHSMSIKKGRRMNTTEMNILIDELFGCQMPYSTAKGQTTLITLTLEEIAKKF